jgi:hypothetical protein
MKKEKKAFLYNLLGLLCGIWFLLFGWMWGFLANLIMAYPIGLVGLLLWYRGRKIAPASVLNRVALGFFVVGFIVSVAAFFIYK